jgi:type IV secretory pathway VirB2 component (pilin)
MKRLKHINNSRDDRRATVRLSWRLIGMAVLVSVLPQAANAGTPMAEVLCFVLYDILMGWAGKGMATIGVSAVGVAALMGKASWGLALTVIVGIATLFGCVRIVSYLGLGFAAC